MEREMRDRDLPDEVERAGRSVIGAAIEVHTHLGPGLLESIYEEALAIELEILGLRAERQAALTVVYKERGIVGQRVDLLVEGMVVVELKSLERIHPVHKAQTLSYCRAGGFPLGLLINFNTPSLRDGIHRVINLPTGSTALSTSRPSPLRHTSR